MKRMKTLLLIGLGLAFLVGIGACTSSGTIPTLTDANTLLTAQAANPLPTEMAGQGLRVVPADVCQVQEYETVSNSDPQDATMADPHGDMMAWSPERDELAYLRPVNGRWAWFVGDLVVYDFEMQKEVYTTKNLEVFGDLTWSPDGADMAYIVLNPAEKVYTVYVGGLTQSLSVDIFGSSAKTDDYSSKKGIIGWDSGRNIVATSSCGLDCSRSYNYNTETQILTKQTETRKNADTSLTLVNQNTSPNGLWKVVVDQKDNVWLAKVDSGVASVISAGDAVREIKWSSSSKYLAIRYIDNVKIYDVTCKK